ncbi:MAG: cation diffusion facilitator family transporter [Lachnospiraceae bacterium]|nr:cation diffusion facilitator family transporter [Lachnospiraceae bacterium]
MDSNENKKIAMRISNVSIVINVVLSALKMLSGVIAHSSAMISDAVHSLSDVLSTFVVMAGIHISSKASDDDHQYGHERYECVASIILATMLGLTGAGIGYSGIKTIVYGAGEIRTPGMLALIAAIVSIVVKEAMFWYTKAGADKINSGALMADAWHHRSDAMSSVGSLLGIGAARLGYPIFDPIASIVICLFIFKAAWDIYKDAINKMVDSAVDDETLKEIREAIETEDGVMGIDAIRTRIFGSKYYVDVEISADGSQSLREAHEIAERIHDKIESQFADAKHVMVHVNPYEEQENS